MTGEADKVHRQRLHAVMCRLEKNRDAGTPRPLRAVELAVAAGVKGSHENQRRRARELIAELHETGTRICACTGHPDVCGYWLARGDGEWKAYCEARRSKARYEFAIVRDAQQAAGERQRGQGLFAGVTDGSREAWARA